MQTTQLYMVKWPFEKFYNFSLTTPSTMDDCCYRWHPYVSIPHPFDKEVVIIHGERVDRQTGRQADRQSGRQAGRQTGTAIYDTAWSLSCLPRTRYSMSDLSILLRVLTWRLKGDVSQEGTLISRFKFRVFDVVYYKTSNGCGLRLTKTRWFWWETYIYLQKTKSNAFKGRDPVRTKIVILTHSLHGAESFLSS